MDLTSNLDFLGRHEHPTIALAQLKQCSFFQEGCDRRIPREIWNYERERTVMADERALVVRKRMKCFFRVGMDLRSDHEPILPEERLQRCHLCRIDDKTVAPCALLWPMHHHDVYTVV